MEYRATESFLLVVDTIKTISRFKRLATFLDTSGKGISFLALDSYYREGVSSTLLESPYKVYGCQATHCPEGWEALDVSGETRTIATFEAIREFEELFRRHSFSHIVVANELGPIEWLLLRAADRHGAKTICYGDSSSELALPMGVGGAHYYLPAEAPCEQVLGLLRAEKEVQSVSVAVIIDGSEADIFATLSPLLEGTAPVAELLVCDTSGDGAVGRALCRRFTSEALKVVHEPLAKKARALNVLVEQCTQDIFLRLESHCQPHPLWAKELVATLNQVPSPAVVFSAAVQRNSLGFPVQVLPVSQPISVEWLEKNPLTTYAYGLYTEQVRGMGRFREGDISCDMDALRRLLVLPDCVSRASERPRYLSPLATSFRLIIPHPSSEELFAREKNPQIRKLQQDSRLLSVIIVGSGGEERIRQMGEALRAQTLEAEHYEVIYVNGSKTQISNELLNEVFVAVDGYLIEHEHLRTGALLNEAIQAASGERLLFLSDLFGLSKELFLRHCRHDRATDSQAVLAGGVLVDASCKRRMFSALLAEQQNLFPQFSMRENVRYDYNWYFLNNLSVAKSFLSTGGSVFSERDRGFALQDPWFGHCCESRGAELLFLGNAPVYLQSGFTVEVYVELERYRAQKAIHLCQEQPNLLPFYFDIADDRHETIVRLRTQHEGEAETAQKVIAELQAAASRNIDGSSDEIIRTFYEALIEIRAWAFRDEFLQAVSTMQYLPRA